MQAIGYARVSTQEQAQEGVSLPAQRAQIEAWCQAKRWTLRKVFSDEGVSAATLRRPGLQAALAALDRGEADVLIITKLDRLSRSALDVLRLVRERFGKNGATVCSIHESWDATTPMGRFGLTLLAAVAELESDQASERTKAALAYKRGQGDWQGSVPYGWRAGPGPGGRKDPNQWAEVAEEQAVLHKIGRLREEGLSLRAIADRLNEEQAGPLPGRIGQRDRSDRWHHATVAHLLGYRRPKQRARWTSATAKA